MLRVFQNKHPQLGERVYVDLQALVLGDVSLGDDCSVWPMAVIRGDMHRIRIGKRTSIQDNAVLHITHASAYRPEGFPLTLGDDVTVGHGAILHGCTLGNRVLIGMGSRVLDGAVIDDEVMLGANALVPPGKHLASGYLYVGSPAKPARPLTDDERRFLSYSAANYVKLKDQYLVEYAENPAR